MPTHTDTALIIFACIVASLSVLGVLGIALCLLLYIRAQRKRRPPS